MNEQVLKENLSGPDEDGAAVFLCGPPGLIQKGATRTFEKRVFTSNDIACNVSVIITFTDDLTDWGYEEDKNIFGF